MFSLMKKKLDNKITLNISIEVGMFQSWTLENRNVDLSPDELKLIVSKILKRENINAEDSEISAIVTLCLASSPFDENIEKFRRQTGFDITIASFCKSINLSSKYYTPVASAGNDEISDVSVNVDAPFDQSFKRIEKENLSVDLKFGKLRQMTESEQHLYEKYREQVLITRKSLMPSMLH